MSFTSVLPAPQILLKAVPPPPTDTAKGIDALVSLTVYAAPKDAAKGVDALSALAASIPPQLDTAKAVDLPALAGLSLYGYILRLVKKGDIILPDDQNNLVYAWRSVIDSLSKIESKLRQYNLPQADTLAIYIGELKSIVGSMPLVKEGDWVYSDHFNLHLRALRKLIEIEEWLNSEVCRWRSDTATQLLYAMESYGFLLSERRTGDVVASADWNNIKQALTAVPRLNEIAYAYASPYNQSGLAPEDPLWAPPDGWTVVLDFASIDEVKQLFTSPTGYEVVEDGLLTWNLPFYYSLVAVRESLAQSWTRMAICMKMKLTITGLVTTWMFDFTSSVPASGFVRAGIGIVDSTLPLKFRDFTYSPILEYDFTPPDDWFVMVMDNTPNQPPYFRVYDRNKNLVFEVGLRRAPTSSYWERLIINVWNTPDFITDYKVDWIAFKY
jgi:hypothetical protein